jgi:hypothetical protein
MAPAGNALACDSPLQRYPSSLQIANSIFWNGGEGIWNNDNSAITITYSNVQGGWPGEGNIDADPCFVQPQYLGPLAYWKLDENVGTTAYDSVGDNHGNVYGAQWTSGKINGALSFDGVDDYVNVEDNITLEPQKLTVSAWVYRESTSSQHVILQKGSTHFHDDRNGYLFKILESSNSYPNRAILHVTINNRCDTSPISNTEIQAGIWYHIAATYDGSYARIYVNGVEDGTDISDTGPVDYSGGYQDFKIGVQEEGHGLLCGHFDGIIDEVAIYGRALSADEIQQHYQNGLSGHSDYHLLPDSPCINTGDPDYPFDPNETDLDGLPRVIGGRIDMGAYELNRIPIANAGADQVAECACNTTEGTKVILNGTGSYDPDDKVRVLAAEGAGKRVLVPTGPISEAWRGGEEFDDSGWNDGLPIIAGKTGGVGYERSSGYEDYITYDVESGMYGNNSTCYIRIRFTVDAVDLARFKFMLLKIRCDDGFIAYLNGDEVMRKNSEGIPVWNSKANGTTESAEFEYYPVSNFLYALQAGDNILAIHGLNNSATSSDFLISAELVASETEIDPMSEPSPLEYTWTGPFVESPVDGATPTVTLEDGCPGDYVVTLVVNDGIEDSEADEVLVTVVDTTGPAISCPANVTLECPADTSVEANGSATAGDTCATVTIGHSDVWQPGCGNTGTLTRTWMATDECGNSSSCVQTITVVDTTPPEFEFSVSPTLLWPPSHKMVEITPSWMVSDECDAAPEVSLVSIVANEGDDIIGDGHTSDDIIIGDDGSIFVRSERSGTNTGRIYTITYQAVDDCGNTTVRSAIVSIPHELKLLARIGERWLWRNHTGNLPEDLNSDGIVNLKDFAQFAENWIK